MYRTLAALIILFQPQKQSLWRQHIRKCYTIKYTNSETTKQPEYFVDTQTKDRVKETLKQV